MLRIREDIQLALDQDRPVVALESTLIAHGMPWPQNFETGLALEAAVRKGGALPATIALRDGQICVGLEPDELEALAREGQSVAKCSRRDMPFILARREHGATTVAATLIAADMAGIAVFATGGIGGVHRGADRSFDVSADLQELARRPVTVVCAGAKSILDLPATLEVLETLGVPVVGYGTDEFPAFYTPHSGLPVDFRVDNAEAWTEAWHVQRRLFSDCGMLVCQPLPATEAADFDAIERAQQQALEEADKLSLRGKAITPFLLGRIAEISGGESLAANIRLALHNAHLGAELATALANSSPSIPGR